VRVVQTVLQRDRCAEGVADQHQILVQALRPEPATHPLGVAGDVRAARAFEVPRERGRDAAGEVLQLMRKGVGAGAGARSMDEYELWHRLRLTFAAGARSPAWFAGMPRARGTR